MDFAKIFWSGRSQAVRLPKAYRIDGDKVRIRRHGSAIILEPCPNDWQWLKDLTGPVDADFEAATQTASFSAARILRRAAMTWLLDTMCISRRLQRQAGPQTGAMITLV